MRFSLYQADLKKDFHSLHKTRSAPKTKADAFQRGGNYENEDNAGVFALNLNNAPSNSNDNIGFRCIYFIFARFFIPKGIRRTRPEKYLGA